MFQIRQCIAWQITPFETQLKCRTDLLAQGSESYSDEFCIGRSNETDFTEIMLLGTSVKISLLKERAYWLNDG